MVVKTNKVCGVSLSHEIGTTFYSDTCGGGAWDLTQLKNDLVYQDASGYAYLNPCGQVQSQYCSGLNASLCYVYSPQTLPPSNDWLIAVYDPVLAPVKYQVASNGLYQTLEDGGYCTDGGVSTPRVVNIFYQCVSGANPATITSYTVSNCVYTVTVATTVTCGKPFHHGGSGLSGGAIAGIVIGVVVGVLLILLAIYFFCCVLSTASFKKSSTNESVGAGAGAGARGSKFNEMEESQDGGVETSQVEMGEHHTEEEAETA